MVSLFIASGTTVSKRKKRQKHVYPVLQPMYDGDHFFRPDEMRRQGKNQYIEGWIGPRGWRSKDEYVYTFDVIFSSRHVSL